ncbi:hypothetical protein KPH14_000749 [Odynerus spinipes]|uniref:Uncharacterized protein n=1 Tax=Odynerus spinipes TaxID=1348599 RepID=A0AAD9R9K6_9HYME|nr:hypothetical protein KPH14_000749 [Odynerus spinipes]
MEGEVARYATAVLGCNHLLAGVTRHPIHGLGASYLHIALSGDSYWSLLARQTTRTNGSEVIDQSKHVPCLRTMAEVVRTIDPRSKRAMRMYSPVIPRQ